MDDEYAVVWTDRGECRPGHIVMAHDWHVQAGARPLCKRRYEWRSYWVFLRVLQSRSHLCKRCLAAFNAIDAAKGGER